MKRKIIICCISLFMLLFINITANAADWRFPLGFSYVSGFKDVKDVYKDNLEAKGYTVDYGFDWPVGLTFQPYVQFENGLGVGLGFGPAMFIITNASNDAEDISFTNVPVNLDMRYSFMPSSNTSPYIRAGGRYNIASGDYVESSSVGFFGGAGIEFGRTKTVGGGLEVSYDTSEIEFEKLKRGSTSTETENIKPGGLMVSIFVVF